MRPYLAPLRPTSLAPCGRPPEPPLTLDRDYRIITAIAGFSIGSGFSISMRSKVAGRYPVNEKLSGKNPPLASYESRFGQLGLQLIMPVRGR